MMLCEQLMNAIAWRSVDLSSASVGCTLSSWPVDTVYGDIRLDDYHSSLTMPRPLYGKFSGGEELQFYDQLGSDPAFR